MVRDKLYISKEYGISPSEVNKLFYFEYEQIKMEINLIQKEQEKREKEQEKQYKGMNPSSISRSMQNSMKTNMSLPKMSSLPSFNFPKN